MEPKRPGPAGWVLATGQPGGRGQRWVHDETGLVVDSSIVHPSGHGGPQYCLAVGLLGGGRCSAATAFLALADFGLLDAAEDDMAGGAQRVFRLPLPAGL